MKARLDMRAALALGLAPVARAARLSRALSAQASHELGRGNVLAAVFLVGLQVLGL